MTIKNIQGSHECQNMTTIMHYQSQNVKSAVKPKDSIDSTTSCRSFGRCVLNYFIFTPVNFIVSFFKTIIWAITFGTFFSRTVDLKKVQASLENDVYPIFNKNKATSEQKKVAWETFVNNFPGHLDKIVEDLIEADRNHAQAKQKVAPEKIAEWTADWNKTNLEPKRKTYSESISVEYDAGTIHKYMDLLDKKNNAAQAN